MGTVLRRALIGAVMLAGLAAPLQAQVNPGRIEGTLVDDQGQPVGEVKLAFTPDGASGRVPRTLKVNKKGKFSHAFFPSGTYRVSIDDPNLFLESMVYLLKDVSGIEIDRKEAQAHPTQGLPPVEIRPSQLVQLDLVVATKEKQAELTREVGMIEARGKLEKSSELYAAGDMEGVVASTEALLADDPELGGAHYLRGAALSRLGRTAEAEQALRKAVELVPDQPGVWAVFGTVLLDRSVELEQSGQAAPAAELAGEAARSFSQDLARDPGNVKSLTNRAVALDKAGDTQQLEPALRALLEADPDNTAARSRLATLLSDTGRADEALELLSAAGGADADNAARIYNVAVKLYNEDKYDEALEAARRVEQIDPDLPRLHRLLGRIHLAQGDDAAAIAEIEKYLALAPEAQDVAVERQLLESLKKQAP